jgi:ATP-dependent Lon protease
MMKRKQPNMTSIIKKQKTDTSYQNNKDMCNEEISADDIITLFSKESLESMMNRYYQDQKTEVMKGLKQRYLTYSDEIRKRITLKILEESFDYLYYKDWYFFLPIEEKIDYSEKVLQLFMPPIYIPNLKDLLDKNIDTVNIKHLLTDLKEINYHDKLDPDYDTLCYQYTTKVSYFSDKETTMERKENSKNLLDIYTKSRYSKPLKENILSSHFDTSIKTILLDKYTHMCLLHSKEESSKHSVWLQTVLSIPHKPKLMGYNFLSGEKQGISYFIHEFMNRINNKVYGMNEAKEELICTIINMLKNPNLTNKVLAIVGPPGTGKTFIFNELAKILDLPLAQISLGGENDASFLLGHDFTHTNSQPGIIARSIIKNGCTNGFLFFDELDKISNSEKATEIIYHLHHIIDFTQNHNFRDRYMPEIPINLSECFFVYSLNDIRKVDSSILSRIPIIHFSGYDKKDKIEILQKYLIPEVLKEYNLEEKNIMVSNTVCGYLIDKIKEEDEINDKSGIRGLKQALHRIFKRINLYFLSAIDGKLPINFSFHIPNFQIPYSLDEKFIDQVIKEEKKNCNYQSMYI